TSAAARRPRTGTACSSSPPSDPRRPPGRMLPMTDKPAVRYPFADTLPPPGEALQVAPGAWWIRMPLPFALDHINLWLLEDGDGWTIVDTGIGLEATWSLWERVMAGPMGGRPVRRIVVTHYHPDHVGSA